MTAYEEKAMEQFAALMIEKVRTISKDWHKPWFTEGAMVWPRNLYGREYGSMNAFMLMLLNEEKGYKLPIFCTFDTVKYMNFVKKDGKWVRKADKDGELPMVHVNKGEKSFPVFLTTYTAVKKETGERIKFETFKLLSDDEQEKYDIYPSRKVYNVFNIDQTNMKDARPEMYQKYVGEYTSKDEQKEDGCVLPDVDEMIAEQRWYCPITLQYQDKAYYNVKKNAIMLPEKRQFETGEDFYGTLFHEMTHSTGANALLGRFGITIDQAMSIRDRAREELVAEMGSALVAARYGIEKRLEKDNAAYLNSWLECLGEKPKYISTVLTDVKKAVRMITERIECAVETAVA